MEEGRLERKGEEIEFGKGTQSYKLQGYEEREREGERERVRERECE